MTKIILLKDTQIVSKFRNIFFLLFFSIPVFCQKEANIWYFGEKAGLDFSSGVAVPLLDGQLNTLEGCATISDAYGNLLFYTDGITVYNRNHNIMPNGTNLMGNPSSTHSAIIVPKPKSENIYYIFTVDTNNSNSNRPLAYSEVDMSLNSELGRVVTKNIILNNSVNEKVAAVKKSTIDDNYWIVSHTLNSNKFITFELTDLGVNNIPIESNTGSNTGFFNISGQLKISPDNSRLVAVRGGEVQLFDFNNFSGVVSNPITLDNASVNSYGAEFSPNGKILYISYYGGLLQFNLSGSPSDIISSKIIIANEANANLASMQTAPDGKIYIARYGKTFIDVIENPNVIGTGCNYLNQVISLNGRKSYLGLPTFIQSYFRIDDVTFSNTCFGNDTNFNLNNTVDSATWNFGDPASGVNNVTTGVNVNHVFSAPGVYTVTTAATLGTEVITINTEVVIYQNPTATQPTNLLVCDLNNDGFFNFNLKNLDASILNGQNPDDFSVDYYANSTDYANNTQITDYTNYVNAVAYQEQTIIASVKNKNNTSCEATANFTIQVFKSPTPALSAAIPSLSDCDNTSVGADTDGKITFNLKDRETAILNGQSDTDFLVTYFLDENLTQLINNPTDYPNTTPIQRVYAKVENKQNSSCFAKTSFLLEVDELPIINNSVTLKQCDNGDINGFSSINLDEAKAKIITNPDDYTITFFEEKALAEGNTNPIPNPANYTNQIVSNDVVWARVENTKGCIRVSEVNLVISTTQIPTTFQKEYFQCDDGTNIKDGIATFDFSDVINEVISIFPTNQQLEVTYYQNEEDALSEKNKIDNISNYQNTNSPNQQIIYVRVDSQLDNDCLGLGAHITLNVEKVPVANTVTINPECDNDRDGLFSFDTSTIQSKIIGSQTDVAISYFDENGTQLSGPLPNPFSTASQTITARVENTISQDPNGQCYNETTISFVVNTLPIANSVPVQEECDDDTDGIFAFDTSTIENIILGTQTGLIVKYFDENNNALPSPLPNPFNTSTQTIRVRVENPIYDVCYEETTVDFIVREKPTVSVIDEDIICMTNNPQLQIEVENPNVNYNYTWRDENNIVVGNAANTAISKGGKYTVIGTSVYGCDSEEATITIRESSISTININDIEVRDDSDNNFIKINTTNLGLGNYEFRLLDANSNILVDYQDDSNFENLDGGSYIVEVNDKNGCGSVPFKVSLITFPKYFTPNGDSLNDFWQIKGIDKGFYRSGVITIYNRYGKLICRFTINDIGWDGTYNGKVLLSDDYWFKAVLIDTRDEMKFRTGNFSLLRK